MVAKAKQLKAPAKRQAAAPESGPGQKVVIRYTDGRVQRAFLSKGDEASLIEGRTDSLVAKDSNGKPVKVEASEIKAVFFVKSFEGNPDYSEFKVFSSRPGGKGIWVRVHFKDGEVIEGVAPNNFDTFSKPIFYMTPPDPGSNNHAVIVSKLYLTEMLVLGLAVD